MCVVSSCGVTLSALTFAVVAMPLICALWMSGVHVVPLGKVYDVDVSRTASASVAVGVGLEVGAADGELDGAIVDGASVVGE